MIASLPNALKKNYVLHFDLLRIKTEMQEANLTDFNCKRSGHSVIRTSLCTS